MHAPYIAVDALKRTAALFAALLAAAFALVFSLPQVTRAAVADESGTGVSAQTLSDHTVSGVSPRGTTINLFDYWVSDRDANDQSNPDNWQDSGINAGNVLKFGAGMGTDADVSEGNLDAGSVNYWTNSAAPRTGIVSDLLGSDGYPTLSTALGGATLGYLFNSQSFDGKQAYMDVDGLLQVDEEGYYYFNSQQNFAEFDEGSDGFTLYDTWGVTAGGQSPDGQFFPFNAGGEVFDERGGSLVQNGTVSTDAEINHYFGMSMSTRFVQQYGGHTDQDRGREVTYNFSGDDDVWVYIDDVLVGDLGGIHNATALEINFSTGMVYVYDDANGNNVYDRGEEVYNGDGRGQTLKQIFQAAGRDTSGFSGDTFADDTYHTLDFFYLERGNTDSNMSLKYNLVNIPESGVLKIDQDGESIEGVGFALYPADADYGYDAGGAYYTGTTDGNGGLTFTTTEGSASGEAIPVTLEQLNAISDYWVLVETGTPEGYRNPGEMHLRFEDGVLLSSNQWDTGAYSQPHVTATATDTVYRYGQVSGAGFDADAGTMFAVVLQKQDDGTWAPVSGDVFGGWTVGESIGGDESAVTQSVLDAARANPCQFLVGSGGAYEVDIENLPGDITTYAYMLAANGGDAADAKYTVAYYYTTADSIDGATTGNTFRMQADATDGYAGFERVFSVTLNISNVKSELTLEKTDSATGEALPGATYALYVDADGDGTADGETPLNTMTTDEDGALDVTTDGAILAHGTYVLVETAAPEGYALDDTPIRIAVDNDGVHVDAGTADDNVSVETELGSLVHSMRSFAADDRVDATLHEVKAQPQTAASYDGSSTAWSDDGDALHYQYQDLNDQNALTYQPAGGVASYTAEEGWSRLNVTQCTDSGHSSGNGTDYKQILGDQSLNGLFTGEVTVHVTDDVLPTLDAEQALSVEKTLSGHDLSGTQGEVGNFSYTVTPVDTVETDEATGEEVVATTAAEAGAKIGLSADEQGELGSLTFSNGDAAMADTDGDGVADAATTSMNPLADGLTFTAGDVGKTFTYQVAEVVPDPDETEGAVRNDDGSVTYRGVTYDTAVHTVAYTVVLADDGTRTVEASVDGRPVEAGDDGSAGVPTVGFANTYAVDPSSLTLDGVKEYVDTTGANPLLDGMFSFVLTAVGGVDAQGEAIYASAVPMPEGAQDGVAIVSNVGGTFAFPAISYSSDDAGNTYIYQIGEQGTTSGMHYDGSYYTIEVAVSVANDPQTGRDVVALDVTVDKTSPDGIVAEDVGTDAISFTNTFDPPDAELSGETALGGTKTLSGRAIAEGETFSFTLTPGDDATRAAIAEGSVTVEGAAEDGSATATTAAGDGTSDTAAFAFGAISFAKAGTYTFYLTEDVPEGATQNDDGTWSLDGVTYDAARVKATVEVRLETIDSWGTKALTASVAYAVVDGAGEETPVDAVSFTNSYSAEAALVDPTDVAGGVAKVLEGNRSEGLKEGEFSFELSVAPQEGSPADGYTLPAQTVVANAADGTVDFDPIAFTKEGVYDVTIVEAVPAEADRDPWMSYDTHAFAFTVTVSDDGSGRLAATVSGADEGEGTFTNVYDAPESGKTAFGPDGSDADGGTLNVGDTLTYEITWVNDAVDSATGASVPAVVTVTDVVPAGTELVFGDDGAPAITGGGTYDEQSGSIVWNLGEQAAGATGTVGFTVRVTPDAAVGGGVENTATVQVGANDPTTTNTVVTDVPGGATLDGSVYLSGTKTLTGRTLQAGDFTFQLRAGDDATAAAVAAGVVVLPDNAETAVNDADGAFAFGDVTFYAAGDYAFSISELDTGKGGVTYDRTVYTVTVHVEAGVDGNLAATVTSAAQEMVFANSFTAQGESSAVTPAVSKTLVGRDMAAGEFSFTVDLVDPATGAVLDGNVSVGTSAAAADGETAAIAMSPIVYDASRMSADYDGVEATQNADGTLTKVFTYRIGETTGEKGGVSYDAATYLMRVTVTVNSDGTFQTPVVEYLDADGSAVDAAGNALTGAAFVNSYSATEPATFTPQGSKSTSRFTGDGTADGTDLSGMRFSYTVTDAAGTEVATGWSDYEGAIAFSSIELPKAEGTYEYAIAEVDTGVAGITVDGTAYLLTVTVADGGEGSYVVAGYSYTNLATGEAVDEASFQNVYDGGTVALNLGATKVLDAGDSGRTLRDGEFSFSVIDEATGETVATGTNDAAGNVTFGSIYYSYSKTGAADAGNEGTTDEEGAAGEGAAEAADAPVDGAVALDAGTAGDGAASDTGAAGSSEDGEGQADDGSPADGAVPDGGQDNPADESSQDASDATASDTAVSGADGGTAAEEETGVADEGADAASDEGAAPADGTAESSAASVVGQVADLLTAGTAVADSAGAVPYASDGIAADAGAGSTASSSDLGEHWYRIVENAGSLGGVTYDRTCYRVCVSVTDNVAAGTIEAAVTQIVRVEADGTETPVSVAGADGMDNVVFTNSYAATVPATATVELSKTLTGRAMEDGEFGFVLTDASGNVVRTATSAAASDGETSTVSFGAIEYAIAGDYEYTVSEVNGGMTVDGVSYSAAVYRVVVHVVDNGDGTLAASVEYPDGVPAFENVYRTSGDATVSLEATKTLTGRAMEEGEFGFKVYDADGNFVAGGQNAAAPDGETAAVTLGTLTFTEVGEYDYTVVEVQGSSDGVTYDERAFRVHVTVSDDGAGGLAAEVDYPDGVPSFVNAYEEEESEQPEDPEDSGQSNDGGDEPPAEGGSSGSGDAGGPGSNGSEAIPQTGDATNDGAAAIAAGAGVALLAGGCALGLRRRGLHRRGEE